VTAVVAALALGLIAALLPGWLGTPDAELPALRGVASGVTALLIALSIAFALGAGRVGRDGRTLAGLSVLLLATGGALLPGLLLGVSWAELDQLWLVVQKGLRWSEPLPGAVVAAVGIALAAILGRLNASLHAHPLRGLAFLLSALPGAALFVASAFWSLARVPAPVGVERLEKLLILGLLLLAGAASLLRSEPAIRDPDRRTLALGLGVTVLGLTAVGVARIYLSPSIESTRELVFVRSGVDGTEIIAAPRGRPDLRAVYVLPNASDCARLAFVRAGGVQRPLDLEHPERTRWGFARLERGAAYAEQEANRTSRRADVSWLDVRYHLARPFRMELRPGIRIPAPVFDWAVLPNGLGVVASGRDEVLVTPRQRYFEQPEESSTFSVRIHRPGFGALRPRALVADLPYPPRFLEVSAREVRLLVAGMSYSRGRLRARAPDDPSGVIPVTTRSPAPYYLGVTRCDLQTLTCEPWRTSNRTLVAVDSRGERLVLRWTHGLDVVDARTLEPIYSISIPYSARESQPAPDQLFPLSNGGLAGLGRSGKMPEWRARAYAYDPKGRPAGVLELGNIRLMRFAGELADGSLAIFWRKDYSYGLSRETTFGWVLEAWNPTTGERRRLADDLGAGPSGQEEESTRVFVDRQGRILTLSGDRLVEVRGEGWF